MYKRKYLKYFVSALLIGLFSCNQDKDNLRKVKPMKAQELNQKLTGIRERQMDYGSVNLEARVDSLNSNSLQSQLVDLFLINSSIKLDLKYASADNFMKMRLYDTLTKAYLQKEVAERLGRCQEFLTAINNNLYLLVYDAVRPISVQKKMWDALDSIPVSQRVKFVSNPANGSIHNYGAAVDLTICDGRGIPLDMGAEYDDIRKIAYPSLEAQFLNSGELTQKQLDNRKLLRKVMTSQNFRNIPTEWWHFNAFSRDIVKLKYAALK